MRGGRTARIDTETQDSTTERQAALPSVAPVFLVALTAMISLQLARVFASVVFDLGERRGTTVAAITAGGLGLLVFLAPMVTPLVQRVVGRRALLATTVALAASRMAVQVYHPIPLWLAAMGTVFALWALTLLLIAMRRAGRDGTWRYVQGLLLGLALDSALRAAFFTWDYSWQGGLGPFVLAALPAAGIVLLAAGPSRRSLIPGEGNALGGVVPTALVGLFLWLEFLFLQSVAFVASAAGVSVPWAAAVVLAGDAVALGALALVRARAPHPVVRWAGGVALVVAAYILRQVDGLSVVALVVIGQALTAPLLASALAAPLAERRRSTWGISVGFGLGTFAFMLFIVLYQIQYRVPLPFPNRVLAPVAALLLAFGGARVRGADIPARAAGSTALIGLPLLLLLVPLVLALAQPDSSSETGNGKRFRLVDYNVHLAINEDGQLDPEGISRAIESSNPDVVTLQEVPRGWAGAGTIDLAEWLSHELRMRFVFAPAADGQFGNVILSRFPIEAFSAVLLPQDQGAQRRSYLRADIDIGKGLVMTVIGAHLEGSQPDHRVQVRRLLAAAGSSPHTIVAGDMNMQPDNPDRTLFDAAGLASAQDVTGNGALSSSAHPNFPGDRPDWIFGGQEVSFSGFRIEHSEASDHLPLAVTASVG